MKTRMLVLLAMICVLCGASKYANVLTNWQGDTNPDPITDLNGNIVSHPTLQQYQAAGYRYVTATNQPAQTNLIATSWTATDIDGTNCYLAVSNTYDWVAANAQAASNAAAFHAQQMSDLSNQVQQTILGTNPNYAVAYATAWAAATAGVKAGSWATMAAATNAIIQKAYGQIK